MLVRFKKMFNKYFLGFFLCSFIVFSFFSICESHWIFTSRSSSNDSNTEDINKESDEIDFSQQLPENNSDNATESNILFSTMSDTNNTTESDMELQTEMEMETEAETTENITEVLEDSITENIIMNSEPSNSTEIDQMNEENKIQDALINESDAIDSTTDEKILLYRNNCNLEISIQDTQDLKVKIEFEKLKNNTFGKCCITLNGYINNMLGVMISNIYLYQNASEGEVVKVITADYGTDFVLKEYYSWSNYQPLLLTETHKVYIVLYYRVSSVPSNIQNSHFNLEVFSYHKCENSIHHGNGNLITKLEILKKNPFNRLDVKKTK